MKTLERLIMDYWCGFGNSHELDEWVKNELRVNPNPHHDTYGLFNTTPESTERLLLKIAEDKNDFTPISEKGEMIAIQMLIEFSEQLLQEKIKPYEFCRVVSVFDANFIGLREISENVLEYPIWLGDLWNQCDWCDESWTNTSTPHLIIEEVKRMLFENKTRGAG